VSDDRASGPRLDLGLGGAKGLGKRVLRRLLWPFLRHQVDLNEAVRAELDALGRRIEVAERELTRARDDIEHHTSVLVRHEEPLDRHEFLLGHLEPAFLDLQRAMDLVHDKVDLGQRQAFARYHEGFGSLQRAISELAQRLCDLEVAEEGRKDGWRRAVSEVSLRLGQLDLFLTEARRSFPEPPSPEALGALPTGLAGIQAALDEAFRGPRPVIEERARLYLAELAGVRGGGPVLDLGCGRGELLSVLEEAGVPAYGVDTNADHVAACRARGLDVRHEEALAHLGCLEPASVGAITAIHLVEHLSLDALFELLALAARVVRPGGLLVLETPNPENLVVAASSFYLDPTHRRPLPPDLLAFLVGARGFDGVEIRRLDRPDQPRPISIKPEDASEALVGVVDAVNAHLFAPADYAVVARRP
jgi:SAM-dependent methyltransferase